jgi:hypothetical protein
MTKTNNNIVIIHDNFNYRLFKRYLNMIYLKIILQIKKYKYGRSKLQMGYWTRMGC